MKSLILYSIFFAILLFSCAKKNHYLVDLSNVKRQPVPIDPTVSMPPGTIQINDTLFCDQTEISNLDYKAFLSQYRLIYGKDSKVYKSIIPDTLGYFKRISENKTLTNTNSFLSKSTYFYDQAYDDYPVRGITLEQAILFSNWRSSRVLEADLAIANIPIPIESKQKKQSVLEYFTKNKKSLQYRDLIKAIPHYYIPSVKEFEIIHSKILNKELETGPINSFSRALVHQNNVGHPVRPVIESNQERHDSILYNIFGNLSELSSTEYLVLGGNYLTEVRDILDNKSGSANPIDNQLVGFRNFFVWKDINGQTITIEKK